MRTFSIETLGCKVNQYESEQLASVLRSRGLIESTPSEEADLRIVNTCSVTIQAASKSRQSARRAVSRASRPRLSSQNEGETPSPQRVIVTGCWATSDKAQASSIPGVDAVLTHHDDVAADLDRLLTSWGHPSPTAKTPQNSSSPPEPFRYDGWIRTGEFPAASDVQYSKPSNQNHVKQKIGNFSLPMFDPDPCRVGIAHHPQSGGQCPPYEDSPAVRSEGLSALSGTTSLPLLDSRQSTHQRAFLKIQDGCDAHCTYCIIPQLRPKLWSKPIADAISEARRLTDAGHHELILTGIFLSAYGQPTALRRRQSNNSSELAHLLTSLCESLPNLRRLRLSSLEPGDLTPDLISVMRGLPQIVPHFHLPLQSGSDAILRKMNRQYTRTDFLKMIDNLQNNFDRPALTTDIIVGFPGETDTEFAQTLEVVDHARFIHTHAFPFSPRPRTAAARWKDDFIHGPIVNERLNILRDRAFEHSYEFRQQFLGEVVELLVEHQRDEGVSPSHLPKVAGETPAPQFPKIQHGRTPRYFDVHFESEKILTGQPIQVRIDRVTPTRTHGILASPPLTPSPGTPGEGWGEGRRSSQNESTEPQIFMPIGLHP